MALWDSTRGPCIVMRRVSLQIASCSAVLHLTQWQQAEHKLPELHVSRPCCVRGGVRDIDFCQMELSELREYPPR